MLCDHSNFHAAPLLYSPFDGVAFFQRVPLYWESISIVFERDEAVCIFSIAFKSFWGFHRFQPMKNVMKLTQPWCSIFCWKNNWCFLAALFIIVYASHLYNMHVCERNNGWTNNTSPPPEKKSRVPFSEVPGRSHQKEMKNWCGIRVEPLTNPQF